MTDDPSESRLKISEGGQLVYKPDGETLRQYIADNKHVAIIRGPIGSGSSTASCMRIFRHAMEQRPSSDGIRRSRWAIVRNSYPDLKNTTVKTWLNWFPENLYGTMLWERPMRHLIRLGDVELEVFFLALDDESDIRKLRSLELTGVWFNEIEFIPKAIFDEAESRTGRYPAKKDGGSAWSGVIGDMNAPNEDHWIPQMTGEAPLPDDMSEDDKALMVWPWEKWSYFIQPPAVLEISAPDGKSVVGYKVNPAAENLKWMEGGYYEEKVQGKKKSWIDSRLMNRITFHIDGDPVFPMYREETHSVREELRPNIEYEVIVALDFGRRPTALCGQEIANRLYMQYEFRMYGVSAITFAPALRRFLAQTYPSGTKFRFTGDPKGQDKGQADERTAYEVFESHGMKVTPAPVKNNHLETRLSAVEYVLNDMWMGKPRLIISIKCTTLRAAMAGRYCLKKVNGDMEPVKDGKNAKYSDIADCLQYWCLFVGEGRRMVGLDPHKPTRPMRVANDRMSGRLGRRVS